MARSFKILSFCSGEKPSQSRSMPAGARSSASDVTSSGEPRCLVVASDAGVCGSAVLDLDKSPPEPGGFFLTGEVKVSAAVVDKEQVPPEPAGFFITGFL